MPAASRHAKPKPAAIKIRASILAAATLAGVAAAIVILPGGPGAPKPVSHAVPVTTTAVADSGGDQENPANVRYKLNSISVRLFLRARAAAPHKHQPASAVPRQVQQQATQQTQPAAQPTPAATVRSGQDAASSPLGICIRHAEEGGSYAWGPGNGGGAYQFLLSTWEKYGGAASEYGVAGPAYQDQIFDNAIAAGGASNWTAYDGC
jgi:Transglycosylase-like domain